MSTNNKVFQVLVTKGNASALAAGNTLDDLASGQIGVFDANTNLAIDGTSTVKDFYIAVGTDIEGQVNFSAGQSIQKKNITDVTYRPYVAPKNYIFEITDYANVECDTDYAIRFEFRNMQVYMRQGFNQFTKTYAVRTSCCEGCESCPSGTDRDLTIKLLEALNADESGMFTAVPIADAGGAVITNLATWIADSNNANTKLGIRVTANAVAINKFCSVNTKYYNPRQTVIIPSLIEGFGCTGTLTVTQQATAEEGNGYDIKQKEYHAGGWNGRPGIYRALTATGLAADGYLYFADDTKKYNQIQLVYDFGSTAGWGEYLSNLSTEIAIPQDDTTTRDSFLAILDGLVEAVGISSVADTLPSVNAGNAGAITLPIETFTVSTATATDADGTLVSYLWTQVGVTPAVATITGGTTLAPTFSDLSVAGTYTFKLTATDNLGNQVSDTVDVVVSPAG